ncbi:Putative ribonuclease H protein At1g65750 [Linum perenne]
MTPPRQGAASDMLVWGLENNGRFTIKSAYDLLKDHRLKNQGNSWQKIWSWKGPNKIRHFLWLTAQGRLLTNKERMRRHLAASGECVACGGIDEDLNHVLRECIVAKSIWALELPDVISAQQAHWNFQVWWFANVGNPQINPLFGILAWLIWKRRNMLIFERVAWTAEEVRNHAKFWVLLLSLCRLVNWVEKRRV